MRILSVYSISTAVEMFIKRFFR